MNITNINNIINIKKNNPYNFDKPKEILDILYDIFYGILGKLKKEKDVIYDSDCYCYNCRRCVSSSIDDFEYIEEYIYYELYENTNVCKYADKYILEKNNILNKYKYRLSDLLYFINDKLIEYIDKLNISGNHCDLIDFLIKIRDDCDDLNIYPKIHTKIENIYLKKSIEDKVIENKKKLNKELLSYDMELCCSAYNKVKQYTLKKERDLEIKENNNLKPFFILNKIIKLKCCDINIPNKIYKNKIKSSHIPINYHKFLDIIKYLPTDYFRYYFNNKSNYKFNGGIEVQKASNYFNNDNNDNNNDNNDNNDNNIFSLDFHLK